MRYYYVLHTPVENYVFSSDIFADGAADRKPESI